MFVFSPVLYHTAMTHFSFPTIQEAARKAEELHIPQDICGLRAVCFDQLSTWEYCQRC